MKNKTLYKQIKRKYNTILKKKKLHNTIKKLKYKKQRKT